MIVRDMNKCVLCGLCVRACNEIQVNQVLDYTGQGSHCHGRPRLRSAL